MIIKHCAISKADGVLIVGYAVRQKENFFIYQENGGRIQVIGGSVFPLVDKYERAREAGSDLDEVSGIPVSNLGLGEYITTYRKGGQIAYLPIKTIASKARAIIR